MARLLVFLLFLGALGEEFPTKEFLELLRPTVEKCERETGVDKGLVDKFAKGSEMVDDDKLKSRKSKKKCEKHAGNCLKSLRMIQEDGSKKCYMKCMFVDLNLLDTTTGHFRYERMLNLVPQEMKFIAYEMGKNCLHFRGEDGADLCQVSYDLHRCWQSTDPEHYFLV